MRLVAFLLQIVCALGPNTDSYNAYSDQSPSPDAMELSRPVNASLAAICRPNCPTVQLFRNTTASNVMVISDEGKSKIVYNPDFFTRVYNANGDAAIQAILAHALGHVIDAATPPAWIKREWSSELRADAWTGCSLARLSLSPRATKVALTALSKYVPAGAPEWSARLMVLRAGYKECGGDETKIGE